MRRRPGGYGLVEAMVAAGLFAMVMTIAYDVLVPVLHMWQTNRAQSDIEQADLILETRLAQDLRGSDAASLSTITSPPSFSFLATPTWNTTTGQAQWQQYIVYYLDTDNQILYRKTWPPSPPDSAAFNITFPLTTPVPLSSAHLLAIASSENGSETRACWYVSSLQVSASTSVLSLDIKLSSPGGQQQTEHLLSLELRN